jgi:hypothetical protein
MVPLSRRNVSVGCGFFCSFLGCGLFFLMFACGLFFLLLFGSHQFSL